MILNPKAVTKIQAAIMLVIAILAVGSGAVTYYFSLTPQPKDSIRIGLCADLDATGGSRIFEGATLAVEQINAAGGLLGRNLIIVAEDDDSETTSDLAIGTNALNRLISIDKADYVLSAPNTNGLVYQDICCTQKKILFTLGVTLENLTQRVADNYDQYKYYFRAEWNPNSTAINMAHIQSLAVLKNSTGFTKIGYLLIDSTQTRMAAGPMLDSELPKFGFQIVYHTFFSPSTIDFTSYFAQAEASGAQILFVLLPSVPKSFPLINEWYDRQSPMLICGSIYGVPDPTFWNTTSAKTNCVLSLSSAVVLGYPLTDKTIPVREAYQTRWGVTMTAGAAAAYDTVKYLLTDAINRAGTTESNAVIKTLETANIDTVLAKGFQFTSNHDILIDALGMTSLSQSNLLFIVAQWQNGVLVPIFPESLRIAAGANLKYPPWNGPWS